MWIPFFITKLDDPKPRRRIGEPEPHNPDEQFRRDLLDTIDALESRLNAVTDIAIKAYNLILLMGLLFVAVSGKQAFSVIRGWITSTPPNVALVSK